MELCNFAEILLDVRRVLLLSGVVFSEIANCNFSFLDNDAFFFSVALVSLTFQLLISAATFFVILVEFNTILICLIV